MKYIIRFLSLLLPVSFLFFFQVGVTSCKKEKFIYDTIVKRDTVIRRDTVIKKDTILKKDTIVLQDIFLTAQILASHPWKVQEDRGVAGSSRILYQRGGTSNTMNLDNEYIIFRADKTGTHVHHNGTQVVISWDFANAEHTRLNWTVYNTPATYTITWDNIRYRNGNLYHDQYYTDGNLGFHSHTQQIRIPK